MKECYLIVNTRWGYTCTPQKYKSVASATKGGETSGMAYRVIDVDGRLIKRGWKHD